jgi:hypothetical protein
MFSLDFDLSTFIFLVFGKTHMKRSKDDILGAQASIVSLDIITVFAD